MMPTFFDVGLAYFQRRQPEVDLNAIPSVVLKEFVRRVVFNRVDEQFIYGAGE